MCFNNINFKSDANTRVDSINNSYLDLFDMNAIINDVNFIVRRLLSIF